MWQGRLRVLSALQAAEDELKAHDLSGSSKPPLSRDIPILVENGFQNIGKHSKTWQGRNCSLFTIRAKKSSKLHVRHLKTGHHKVTGQNLGKFPYKSSSEIWRSKRGDMISNLEGIWRYVGVFGSYLRGFKSISIRKSCTKKTLSISLKQNKSPVNAFLKAFQNV